MKPPQFWKRILKIEELSDFLKVKQLVEQKRLSDSWPAFVLVVEEFKHDWGKEIVSYVLGV